MAKRQDPEKNDKTNSKRPTDAQAAKNGKVGELFPEKIIPLQIGDEMKTSYMNYAMSVIVGRALPDVRDGLKPVHRRILYAMRELGLENSRTYKKSARIVGEVLGKYHPHGDSAVYETMVRMVQDFSLRYPLVDGQGNFGSVDGDSAAAMRYTEARLAPIASYILADIDKETVDFAPNFDETLEEPKLLPASLPNLLVNGSSGIAVGMATNIPPHNLNEVIDAILALIEDPTLQIKDLTKFIKGPDFPTGASIVGAAGIRQAYETGRGIIRLRAKVSMEELKGGREAIIVNEIPYQVNKSTLISNIADLVNNKKIEGIADVRDESDRTGMRIVIILKRDAPNQVVLNQLFKHTQMQSTFGIIMLALADGRPKVMALKEILEHYIRHRKEIVIRRSRYDLEKAKDRAHILEGLKVALDNLDRIIKTIRASKTPPIAKEALMTNFDLSERQAQAILEMQLQRLTGLERDKIEEEYRQVLKRIEELEAILRSERKVLDIIKAEALEIKEKFGDERRTQIIKDDSSLDMEIEDLIADEDVVVTISHQGYVKRSPIDTYRKQRRGGVGIMGSQTQEAEEGDAADFIEHLFVASTHDHLLLFTSKGKAYSIRVHELPQGTRTAKGKFIKNFVSLNQGESVNSFIPIRKFEPEKYLVMVTKQGVIKKTELSQFDAIRKSGIQAINLETKSDDLISVRLAGGKDNIFIATRNGKAIHFPEKGVRPMGRAAAGVRGVNLAPKDYVVGMEIVDKENSLLTVTEKGYAKRTKASEYRLQSRGGKGITNISITAKNGAAIGMRAVTDSDDLMVMSVKGMVVRVPVKDVRQTGRAAQGVRVINLKSGDHAATMTCIEAEESLAEVKPTSAASSEKA